MFLTITKDRAKTDDQEMTSYLLVCNMPQDSQARNLACWFSVKQEVNKSACQPVWSRIFPGPG